MDAHLLVSSLALFIALAETRESGKAEPESVVGGSWVLVTIYTPCHPTIVEVGGAGAMSRETTPVISGQKMPMSLQVTALYARIVKQ